MENLKGKLLLMLILVFALASGGTAMAHGGQMTPSTSSLNGQSDNNMAGMDMSGKDKNMDMSGKDKNMDMGMGVSKIKETPPNMKILGTYGAVNLSFIVIGVWNKWFRRKDGLDGNSK